jgi:hypothetical protein
MATIRKVNYVNSPRARRATTLNDPSGSGLGAFAYARTYPFSLSICASCAAG